MEGLVPAELRRESENEQTREEKFVKIVQQFRLKKIVDVQLEILPSAPESIQFTSENGQYFLGITKSALRKLLLRHLPANPWLEAIFLPQSERFWRRLRKAPDSDISWQLLVSRLALEVLPKALEPFAHRRFLLKQQPLTKEIVKSEWNLVYRCADLHRANYHAWEHGRWLHNQRPLLFDFELFAKAFRAHITDCSIGSFCVFLLTRNHHVAEILALAKSLVPLYPENSNLRKILESECQPISNRNAPM